MTNQNQNDPNSDWSLPKGPEKTSGLKNKAREVSQKRWFKPATIAVVAALVIGGGVYGFSAYKESSERKECEDRVIAHAKYPGGASIRTMVKPKIVPSDEEGVETLRGYRGNADFPNGFGVPVNMYYTCKIYEGGRMAVKVDDEIFL